MLKSDNLFKVNRYVRNWVIQHLANNDALGLPKESYDTHFSRWLSCITEECLYVLEQVQSSDKQVMNEIHESMEEGERMYEDAKKFHWSPRRFLEY